MLPHPPSTRRWASLPFGRSSFPFLYRISALSLHLVYIHEIGRTPPSPAAELLLLLPLLLQLANAAADTTALCVGIGLLIQSLPRIIILSFHPFGKCFLSVPWLLRFPCFFSRFYYRSFSIPSGGLSPSQSCPHISCTSVHPPG